MAGDDVQGQPDGDDSGRLAGTVDRPSYPSDGPDDEIPDRYGTPLDRADGIRTPLPTRTRRASRRSREVSAIAA